MKIWIDITNSPHVNFFAGIIRELQKEHEVLITCRPLSNTIDLLEMEGFKYTIVGVHYGGSKWKKIFGFSIRVFQLWRFLRHQKIDVAISHSSFYSPPAAFFLRIPSIYINDNEHAKGNCFAFVFSQSVILPEYLEGKFLSICAIRSKNFRYYPGVKEGIYLWNFGLNSTKNASDDFFNNVVNSQKKTIVIRPEPWSAQYYKGKTKFLDTLIAELNQTFNIILLPRDKNQESYYRKLFLDEIITLKDSYPLSKIIQYCDLFIGAGGTMTREAAVLGVPTISVYQDKLLSVDQFLINNGNMLHKKELLYRDVIQYIETQTKSLPDVDLLKKGEEAYRLIIDELYYYGRRAANRR